jgi:hypothetical protein
LLHADDVPFGQASRPGFTPNRYRFSIASASGDTAFTSFTHDVWLGYPPSFEASVVLGDPDQPAGIVHSWSSAGDGWTAAGVKGGRPARCNLLTNPGGIPGNYFYFQMSDSLLFEGSETEAWIEVTYWDGEGSALMLQYDGVGSAFMDQYKNAQRVSLGGTSAWKTQTYHLYDAWFGNRQNGGADFRVWVDGTVWIHSVRARTAQRGESAPDGTGRPSRFALHRPFPNPFNATVRIGFEIPPNEQATLRIRNVAGQEVRRWSVLSGPNDGAILWDGTDTVGRPVASGLYIVELRCSEGTASRRVVLAR